jgi:hypothetical protein
LWREYQYGSHNALDQLLAYNAEDVRNLKPLMEYVFEEGCRRMDVTPAASCFVKHETPITTGGGDGMRSV